MSVNTNMIFLKYVIKYSINVVRIHCTYPCSSISMSVGASFCNFMQKIATGKSVEGVGIGPVHVGTELQDYLFLWIVSIVSIEGCSIIF